MSAGKSRILFSLGTMLSRVSGMLSYSVKGAVFGAGVYQDAFLIAYRIPNLLREMLAEGALGSSFTKVFSSLWEEDEQRARQVLMDSLWLTFFALTIVCALGMIAAPQLVGLLTMSSASNSAGPVLISQATGMTRVLFPFILFMSLGAVVSGALHQRGRFFLSSVSSIALNFGFIIGSLLFSRVLESYGPNWIEEFFANRGIMGLVLGVLLGGFLQLMVQVAGIWRPLLKGRIARPKIFPLSTDVKKVLGLMGPMVIASSSGTINVLVNSNFATSLDPGAVTWIDNAFRLIHLPVGIFGVALGTVALPALSRAVARAGGKVDGAVSRELQSNIDLVFWLIFPCLLYINVNCLEISQILYQYGRFSAADTLATAEAMRAFSIGILGLGLIKVLSSFYYAISRTSYAMKVSLISILINFAANFFLVKRFGHTGLAMTSSIVISLNAVLLLLGTVKERPLINWVEARFSLFWLAVGGSAVFLGRPLTVAIVDSLFANSLAVWWRAVSLLLLNGTLLVMSFAFAAMLRYKLSLRDLMNVLRYRRAPR